MYARNAQLVSPTSRKKCMLLTENGVGQLIQGLQRERREQVHWWCPQTLCEMGLSQDLYHMETLPKILGFSRILARSGKGKSS